MLPALLLTAFAFFAAIVVQNPRGNTDTELQGFDFFLDVYLICVFSKVIIVHLDGDAYIAYPFPTPSNSSAASVFLASPALEDDEIALTDLAIRGTTDLLAYVPTTKVLEALPPRSALIAGLLALPASGDDEVVCTDLIAYVAAPMVHGALPPRPALIAGLLALPASEDDGVTCMDPIVYVGATNVLPLRPALIAGLLALPASEDDGVACTDPIVYVGAPEVLPPRPTPVAGLIPSPTLSVLPDSEDGKVACTNLAICGTTDLIAYVDAQNLLNVLPPRPAPVAGSLPSTVVSTNSSGTVGGELGPATCPALIDAPSGSILPDTSDGNIVEASNNTIVETSENTLLKELSGISLLLVVGLISFSVVLGVVPGLIILASRTLRQRRSFSGPASERFAEELLPETTCGKGHEEKQSGLESPEVSIGETDPPSSTLEGVDGTPVAPTLPLIEDAGNANPLPGDASLAIVLETPSEDSEIDLSQSAQQEPLLSGAACSGSPLAVSDEGCSSIQSESSSSVADANATTSHVREASGSSTASATPSTGDANEEGPSRKKRKRKRGRRGKGNSGNRIASAQDDESTASTSAAGTSTQVETDEERRRKAAANRFYARRRSQRN